MTEENEEVTKIKEMLMPDEQQVLIGKMSNWQRTMWARDGYSIMEDRLEHFVNLKKKQRHLRAA